ncbi:uncharacterized protein Bfra_005443 [Botrytis fragariae]|uniref:Uncharacterized protein n=1 Tax=Botrytis fragariae TaxID=1964551 RepID=A0A8H6EIZ5_9HELO|nr:uncharacterized protein Bfra_005443 [Botrytis fragariae]KAF5873976.1 hypothetical protein Bfra_005443 [Botrytis fragariae]
MISRYHRVADAQAAIDALKAKLVTQFAQFETERKLHKDREAKLRQQLEDYNPMFLKHEWRRPYLEYLAEVDAAVRCRALEQAKGRRIFEGSNDEFSHIRKKVDIKIIEKGNIACHRGNIKADASLYKLGYRCAKMDEAFFRSIYYLGPLGLDPDPLVYRKLTEALNLRGTMLFCFSFTESSRSSYQDTQFSSLLRQIYITMNDAKKDQKSPKLFDADPEVEQKIVLMRKIAEEVSILLRKTTPVPILHLHFRLITMMDPDLPQEALATFNEEASQLFKLHDKSNALDINLLRVNYEHQQKLNSFAARKYSWYESVNQLFKSFLGLLSGGQTQLNLMKFTHDNIEVTLGTQDDEQSINKAWEESMKNMVESLMAEKSRNISTYHEQKKEILKSINVLLDNPKSMTSTVDNNIEASTDHTRSLVAVLAENALLKLELAKAKYESARVRSLKPYTGSTSSQEILTLKQKLEQVEDEKAELVLGLSATEDELESTRASLADAYTEIESLDYKLNGKNHPNHDLRTLAVNVRLRFLNQATRRNNRGKYTAVHGLKFTDVGAIERGSAAVHGGDVRTDAFMIRNNIHNKFDDDYELLFLRIYGVSIDEVSQGRDGKYRLGSKHVEIADLRGTMSHCLSFSELTHDKEMDDRFDGLRYQCDMIYQEYFAQLGSAAKAQDAFNNNQDIDVHLVTMRNISDHIVGLEKQRLRSDLHTMTFLGPSTTKKVKGIKSSIQEDIRRPLALLSQNINRAKPITENPSSYITNESKKAISVLINQHEQAKSELESHKSSESKMKNEVEELRTQIQELHDTIKHDQDDLKELNQIIEGGMQGSSTIPDTQEALLEKLIAREAVIDREIFNLRDDKVISRAKIWFDAVGKVDESIEHPDQASRDRNLSMRKEMYIRTKRSIAQDTKAALLSTKEDIRKQKLDILRDDSVEGHVPLAPPSPISMDSDQVSYVAETPLDDPFVEDAPQNRDGSWATINGEESSDILSRVFSEDNQTEEEIHRATIEEDTSLRLQIQNTERKIQEWEGNFDRFKLETQATIERLASEISFSEDSLQEYKNALDDADEVRGQLVHNLAQIEGDRDRLCVIVEEVGLPILARNAENMKRIKRDGVFTSLGNSHLPFNEILVRNGDYAATGGHIDAHLASILLCEKEIVSGPVISHEMFLNMYGVSVGEYRPLYKVSDRLDEMFNMHAMLVESGSFTEKTLSETRDSLFQNLFTQGLLQFDTIEAPNAKDKGRIFDSQDGEDQIQTFNEMLEIVQDIKRMQRDAKSEPVSEQSDSEQSVSDQSVSES